MKTKKPVGKIMLTIAAFAVMLVCLGIAFGGALLKSLFPMAFVGRAAVRTFGGDLSFVNEMLKAQKLFEGNWSANLTLDIGDVQGEGLLAQIQAGTLDILAVRDINTREAVASASLKDGQIDLLDVDFYLTDTQFAFQIPQVLNRYLYADPDAFVSQWNGTVFGLAAPLKNWTDESLAGVFKTLRGILFYTPQQGSLDRLTQETDPKKILSGAKYAYRGKEQNADRYEVVIQSESINGFLRDANKVLAPEASPLAFDENVRLLLFVAGGEIFKIHFDTKITNDISGYIEFTGQERITDLLTIALRVDGDDTSLSMEGALRFSEDEILADIQNIEYSHTASEDGETRYNLSAECRIRAAEGIDSAFDLSQAKALKDLHLLDTLTMIRNLSQSVLFGDKIAELVDNMTDGFIDFIHSLPGSEYYGDIVGWLIRGLR